MTAYELRRHLAAQHDVKISGADYGTLLTLHDTEHQGHPDHQHTEPALRQAASRVLYAWHNDRELLEEAMESLKRACFWHQHIEPPRHG